jgi:hypothetical protein
MAMSDAKTGAVYTLPLSKGQFGLPLLVFPDVVAGPAETEYRKDSRLMIIRATPDTRWPAAKPYAYYFLWQADHWTLLRRIAIQE